MLCAALAGTLAAAEPIASSRVDAVELGYLLATPQIADPRLPLAHVASAAAYTKVLTAVVTVADPLETQLGRSFDIQLAALTRAFHAQDFVLDAFALTWDLGLAEPLQRGQRLPADGTASFAAQQRSVPSVLVFRKDLWRTDQGPRHRERDREASAASLVPSPDPSPRADPSAMGSEYFVVFLVGESPTFGVHPNAFQTAITCAVLLQGQLSREAFAQPCSAGADARLATLSQQWAQPLDVIGPTFSGSMDSVASGLAALLRKAPGLDVRLTSPSATVNSNARVTDWVQQLAKGSSRVDYHALSYTLDEQLKALARYAEQRGIDGKVVILAEESTFGRGVVPATIKDAEPSAGDQAQLIASDEWNEFIDRIRVTSFTQNIAAIRAEHARLDRQASETLRQLLSARGELLELDISGIDEITDRPPAYHRALSSRSDELMLFGTLNALRVYVDPDLIVVVATDIRDRLFLLNQLRKRLPQALPVLLEKDDLTAHPDYRKISRGTIVVPAGESLLCLDANGCLIGCGRGVKKAYLAFASDYAANLFRAGISLIDLKTDSRCACYQPPAAPQLAVATLAGFRALPSPPRGPGAVLWEPFQDKAVPKSRLLAANGRLLLELPATLLALIAGALIALVGARLWAFGGRHLVMLAAWRHLNPVQALRGQALQPGQSVAADRAGRMRPLGLGRWLPVVLFGLGMSLVLIATWRYLIIWLPAPWRLTWDLPHGRDPVALLGLFLLYSAVALIAAWRMRLWRQRSIGHIRMLPKPAPSMAKALTAREEGKSALGAVAVGLAFLLMLSLFSGLPTAVDSPLPAALFDNLLLLAAIWFLAELWSEYRRLALFAYCLLPIADLPARPPAKGARPVAGADGVSWASPAHLQTLPQSPFSLHFRRRDLAATLAYSDQVWRWQTRQLLDGGWPFAAGSARNFDAWQARLVAELRYGTTAVRSCAWAAILAPTTILLGMAVYPPFEQPLMTTAAVLLIFIAFALVMYVVVKLEQHPLLGRMFTQHGDRLSIGSAVGALWGKLAAAALILVPVLFPELLSGLHELLESINSL